MIVTLRLALIEFFRAFRLFGAAPGGRGLFWLTLLLALVQALAILLWAARSGVLERSVDAFLGKTEGFGVPIWVQPNYLRREGVPQAIDLGLMAEIEGTAVGDLGTPLKLEPYRDVEGALAVLPGENVWAVPAAAADTPQFFGWAVREGGALWTEDDRLTPSASPLAAEDDPATALDESAPRPRILLNWSLFERYFDVAAYVRALEAAEPHADVAALRAVLDDPAAEGRLTDPGQLPVIWLDTQVHRPRLIAYDVAWAESLGLGRPVAFHYPLDLFEAVEAARAAPHVCFHPEHGVGGRPNRVLKAALAPFSDPAPPGALEALATRFGAAMETTSRGALLTFDGDSETGAYARGDRCDPGVQAARLRAAMTAEGIDLSLPETPPGDLVTVDRHVVQLPCAEDGSVIHGMTKGERDGACVLEANLATPGAGFNRAFLFVPDREALLAGKDLVTRGFDQRLMINRIYEDSLDRFLFLTRLIDALRTPFAVALAAFLGLILFVQLGSLIEHRRGYYGILLARGLTHLQVRGVLAIQMVLATGLSAALAWGAYLAARQGVIPAAESLAVEFRQITKGRVIDLLPSEQGAALLIAGVSLVAAVLIAQYHLARIGVRRGRELEILLK